MRQRIDSTGFGNIKLIQDMDQFCYGIDAVLLADYVGRAMAPSYSCKNKKFFDMCSGNGVVALIMKHMYGPLSITALELQASAADLARRSAELNGFSGSIKIVQGDAKDVRSLFKTEKFDVVSCNPPYSEKAGGPESSVTAKHIARHETTAGLENLIEAAAFLLNKGGIFTMVHRPFRLTDIIFYCRKYGLEPKFMRLVRPFRDEAPNILLISCVKGGGHELKIDRDLIVRNSDGSYSDEINKIYER